ncbi:hypothetical protein AB0V79_27330 [Mesorhizobium ciceri]|uniref:hypothetical protein n=1 Tax=Mesorhizobium ciceri TaxID=39645 RepID=UPI0007A95262|nr:hypothetical protein [Mesorhizobium ciceri]AMY00676.1 hypothetical protein A4R29_15095 [Mesorhizobium ciceri biovar biserrulae]
MISRAQTLRIAALAASILATALPAAATDIVAFIDHEMAQANPGSILILHNKQGWTANTIDTIRARLDAKKFKYAYQTYNDGDRPKDIARPFNWPDYGAVFCFGQNECELVRGQALAKGFEGDFFNAYLEKR